jgi:hypothetical protein
LEKAFAVLGGFETAWGDWRRLVVEGWRGAGKVQISFSLGDAEDMVRRREGRCEGRMRIDLGLREGGKRKWKVGGSLEECTLLTR